MDSLISKYRNEIVNAVETHNTVLISGYPDSYMSTYVPYYLYKSRFTRRGICKANPAQICVVCTRKVEAISNSDSCSTLLNSKTRVTNILGFDSEHDKTADIVYTTDEVLLRKILVDPLLSDFGVIMIANVQDRLLNVDLAIGLLKRILSIRSRLRVVLFLQSASVKHMLKYFKRVKTETSKEITLGDVYHVNMISNHPSYQIHYLSHPASNYLDAIISTVWDICKNEKLGNILIFVPSLSDLELITAELQDFTKRPALVSKSPINIIPMHNGEFLPFIAYDSDVSIQKLSVDVNKRNIYICTNVLDFKFNMGDVSYLIDTCLSKRITFDYTNLCSKTSIMNSTREEIKRRSSLIKGMNGKCFRLLTEKAFSNDEVISDAVTPEISTRDLTMMVLLIKSLGVGRLSDFEFITKPSVDALEYALTILYLLKAIYSDGELIYPAGNVMVELSCSPYLASFVYQSVERGCSEEALIIYAMLQAKEYIWKNVHNKSQFHTEKLDAARLSFAASEGDLISYFNLFQLSLYYKDEDETWLSRHMIDKKGIRIAQKALSTARSVFDRYQLQTASCGENVDLVVKTIFSAFFLNVACKEQFVKNIWNSRQVVRRTEVKSNLVDEDGNPIIPDEPQPYVLIRDMNKSMYTQLYIDPSSFVTNDQPDWIVFNEVYEVEGKVFMQDVTSIKPEYLQELVPHYFGDSDVKPYL
ncbi:Helicase associated domain HA2 containing protein [Theileria equi strain WA]|uniref:Helicase associated domain HA2 containing protein n=1 Tax=Theileria equi strain WA TaxID=1537102 RepID=L0AZT7_THEEQ|nr:Helicase associated domain HA2 containing protein [Theileria equi strain WA]AFZ80516.1 Helicase associated domain HA2 containing protein [Theileria equi strain WA]|eukprot:XP_004830182.1 Helicase associated domain HA2 containing protein [Theileria equi strain WA]